MPRCCGTRKRTTCCHSAARARIARSVGKLVIMLERLYPEVIEKTYQCGNRGAKCVREEFETAASQQYFLPGELFKL